MREIGSVITLRYDARPFTDHVKFFKAEVVKITKTGFRIKNLDEPGRYEDVLFNPYGGARGWNTLTWSDHFAEQEG